MFPTTPSPRVVPAGHGQFRLTLLGFFNWPNPNQNTISPVDKNWPSFLSWAILFILSPRPSWFLSVFFFVLSQHLSPPQVFVDEPGFFSRFPALPRGTLETLTTFFIIWISVYLSSSSLCCVFFEIWSTPYSLSNPPFGWVGHFRSLGSPFLVLATPLFSAFLSNFVSEFLPFLQEKFSIMPHFKRFWQLSSLTAVSDAFPKSPKSVRLSNSIVNRFVRFFIQVFHLLGLSVIYFHPLTLPNGH